MREDMFEVIIERPRGGNWPRKPGRPPRELDDAPRFESTSRRRGGTKWLNENLAPLIRFLQRRVGRPWNEVHKEMSARLSLRSAVQKHVLDHVRQMVERDVVIINGRPYHARGWGGRRAAIADRGWRASFYVCPLTGRLLAAPPYVNQLPEPARERLRLDDEHEAWRLDGIWYRVRFAPVSSPPACYWQRDVLLKRGLVEGGMRGHGGALERHYGRHDRFAVSKQQLSRREVAALARST
jgi:hypothetical protein